MDVIPPRPVIDDFIMNNFDFAPKSNLINFLMKDKYIAFKKKETAKEVVYLLVPMEMVYTPMNTEYYSFH